MLLTQLLPITVKNKINYFRIYQSSAGFTLVELLAAITITSIVVSITGFGLVTITQNNSKAGAETLRRIELNRALDFINDEARMATKIELNAATATVSGFSALAGTSNVQKVLVLTVPGVTNPIVYYTASPPSNSVWSGDRVIYRWGPDFNTSGQYSSPGTNTNTLLVDLIDADTPTPNPDCTTGSPNPAVANRKGFYACVYPNGRVAEVYLRGKLTDAFGNSLTPYPVKTKVFARSIIPINCTVPNINGTTNTAANTAITNAGLISKQNTVTTSIPSGSASSQFPPTGSIVTCNTTVTYNYRLP